ncbi:hypothetical protein HanRHA438_Chr04g0193201 [Helianthus annuus]|nr:hypothetical protein HanRHA438_Chr04g0193201 [Helianthus annuus]
MLLYIRARESPRAHAPLHTSPLIAKRAYSITYEHVSRHVRKLFYTPTRRSPYESVLLTIISASMRALLLHV